jgi:nitrogenase-stabilizing/protective protein
MSELLKQLNALSAAEEFLDFFGVPYEQSVVHVNRLHILKRFHQYLRATPGFSALAEAEQRETGRALLTRAYEDFVRSTPAKEKVFKVFQDADGGHVGLDSLRATLPSRRAGTHECRERQDAESDQRSGA